MDWTIQVRYSGKQYKLDAEIIYHSNQIMRVKVHGAKSHILLENDYPFIQETNSKRAIKWKIKECSFDTSQEQDAKLITDIIHALEYYVKGKNSEPSNIGYIQTKKSY